LSSILRGEMFDKRVTSRGWIYERISLEISESFDAKKACRRRLWLTTQM
jgi:hypothetical protein